MLLGLYPDGGLLDATRTVQQLLEQPEGLPTVPVTATFTSCECDHKYLIKIIFGLKILMFRVPTKDFWVHWGLHGTEHGAHILTNSDISIC